MKKLIKRDCNIHYGHLRDNGDNSCRKCSYFNSEQYRTLIRKGCQTGGTPYIALLGEEVKQ